MKESKVKDYFERIWSLYGNNPAHLLAALVRRSTIATPCKPSADAY